MLSGSYKTEGASRHSFSAMAPNAVTVRTLFSRRTSITVDIDAEPAIIWTLLTQAAHYPNWNSTVISIEGEIAPGQRIRLKSTLAPTRTFSLKVKEVRTLERLVWGDAMGTRTYSLHAKGGDTTAFTMDERIGGPLFPLFARMIPSFDQSFEQFAADLKKAAEAMRRRAGGVA